MKKVILSITLVLAATFAFGQKVQSIPVTGFNGIKANNAFDITLFKGDKTSLVIEASIDVLPYIRSEVKNGVLHLALEKHTPKKLKDKTIKASITVSDLQNISLSGACEVKSNDLFTAKDFNISCSGSSNVSLRVNTDHLSVKASGASDIRIYAAVTNQSKMDISGASRIDLNGSSKSLTLEITGASDIKAESFIANTVDINSSGSSKASLHANENLNVISSGASTINYKGSPSIKLNSSGMSKVSKI